MAGHFDGPDVGQMKARVKVIVLHYPRRVEVMNKGFRWLVGLKSLVLQAVVHRRVPKVLVCVEILVRLVDLVHEAVGGSGEPRVARLKEAEPDGLCLLDNYDSDWLWWRGKPAMIMT